MDISTVFAYIIVASIGIMLGLGLIYWMIGPHRSR